MNGLQTKSNIENLDQLFKRLDCIICIELIPNETCCIRYKPGKMKTLVKIETPNKKALTIPFTELSSVEVSDGKTTIIGTHYDIYS